MDTNSMWTEITPVLVSDEMYKVFDIFSGHPDWPFLPVLDTNDAPIGVVRENDLHKFAYARFGRDLVKRHKLREFLRPSLTLETTTDRDGILRAIGGNPNSDGVVLTSNGQYRAVLLTQAVMAMFEEQRREMEARIVQSQKMEAIGTMAGGIAHDLNNILTPILGYAELIRDAVRDGIPVDTEIASDLIVSAKRARQVVGQILAFSRHKKAEVCDVKVSDMVREVLRMIGPSLPSTIDVETHLALNDGVVRANPTELHQVLMNLCTNAYHAMRTSGGQMRVEVVRHSGPVIGWTSHAREVPGNMLRLTVRDTGTGIPPHLLPRIFEPFYTTKPLGEGTGMGLAVAHGAIARCGGLISVQTEVGKGSAFHVYLPDNGLTAKTGAAAPSSLSPTAAVRGARRLKALFVDDEYQITRLATRCLPRHGIEVEPENDSEKALAALRDLSRSYDVLITDQTMPGLTGIQLVRETLAVRPSLPVIMCTGYSEAVSAEDAKAAGVCVYMLKPPDFEEMARTVRNLADRPQNSSAAQDAGTCGVGEHGVPAMR